jgi:hypothetical protein
VPDMFRTLALTLVMLLRELVKPSVFVVKVHLGQWS